MSFLSSVHPTSRKKSAVRPGDQYGATSLAWSNNTEEPLLGERERRWGTLPVEVVGVLGSKPPVGMVVVGLAVGGALVGVVAGTPAVGPLGPWHCDWPVSGWIVPGGQAFCTPSTQKVLTGHGAHVPVTSPLPPVQTLVTLPKYPFGHVTVKFCPADSSGQSPTWTTEGADVTSLPCHQRGRNSETNQSPKFAKCGHCIKKSDGPLR